MKTIASELESAAAPASTFSAWPERFLSPRWCVVLESPRLWFWNNRLKLLQMVSLAYTSLLSLLDPELRPLREALLRGFCPEQESGAEMSRLRSIAFVR